MSAMAVLAASNMPKMIQISVIINGYWEPGLGDPTFTGWLTVAAYLIASLLCSVYALRIDRVSSPHRFDGQRTLWWSLAVILLLLAINKQLDLQSWFTQVGKEMARSQGWYLQRRTFQMWFIAGGATAGLILFMLAGWAMRHVWRQQWLALFGILFLIGFIGIRATSFHHVDTMLGWHLAGFRMNWILELGGIACIGTATIMNLYRCTKQTLKTA